MLTVTLSARTMLAFDPDYFLAVAEMASIAIHLNIDVAGANFSIKQDNVVRSK